MAAPAVEVALDTVALAVADTEVAAVETEVAAALAVADTEVAAVEVEAVAPVVVAAADTGVDPAAAAEVDLAEVDPVVLVGVSVPSSLSSFQYSPQAVGVVASRSTYRCTLERTSLICIKIPPIALPSEVTSSATLVGRSVSAAEEAARCGEESNVSSLSRRE